MTFGTALAAVIAFGSPATGDVDALVHALREGPAQERAKAASRLAQLGDRAAIPALRDALALEDDFARTIVIQALISLNATEAIDDLRPFLAVGRVDRDNVELWLAAAHALSLLGDEDAVEVVVAQVGGCTREVRSRVSILMLSLLHRDLVPVLEEWLDDEDARVSAIMWLGGLRATSAVERITALARTSRDSGDDDLLEACVRALGLIDPDSRAALLRSALRHQDRRVALAAAQGLSRVRDDAAKAYLLEHAPAHPRLNHYLVPVSTMARLEEESFHQRELSWTGLPTLLDRFGARIGMEIVLDTPIADADAVRLGPNIGLLGPTPSVEELLGSIDGYVWEGLRPESPADGLFRTLSWVYDDGTIRIVSTTEAAREFRRRLGG